MWVFVIVIITNLEMEKKGGCVEWFWGEVSQLPIFRLSKSVIIFRMNKRKKEADVKIKYLNILIHVLSTDQIIQKCTLNGFVKQLLFFSPSRRANWNSFLLFFFFFWIECITFLEIWIWVEIIMIVTLWRNSFQNQECLAWETRTGKVVSFHSPLHRRQLRKWNCTAQTTQKASATVSEFVK